MIGIGTRVRYVECNITPEPLRRPDTRELADGHRATVVHQLGDNMYAIAWDGADPADQSLWSWVATRELVEDGPTVWEIIASGTEAIRRRNARTADWWLIPGRRTDTAEITDMRDLAADRYAV